MTTPFFITEFLEAIDKSLNDKSFVKIALGSFYGDEPGMKSIHIRKIIIKREEKLSFTYRYKTKDIVKNYSFAESFEILEDALCHAFHTATLCTTGFDLLLEKKTLKTNPPTHSEPPPATHDKQKNRMIGTDGKLYLTDLGLTDDTGKVLKSAQDKYRQINKYIEILSGLIKNIPMDKLNHIVDMGCGKGYLTFALTDYLQSQNLNAGVTGVEYRPELVELCNEIAQKSDFKKLEFIQGSIESYQNDAITVLIALHACDTATDDAIFKGIEAKSELIVVAPCCHKQIRREIEKNKAVNDLDFLTRHGIFLERQAEMVTDGLRSLILEYFGYTTKVIEFISDSHTPKNVMIIATRQKFADNQDKAILDKIKSVKDYFGIDQHYLEKLLKI